MTDHLNGARAPGPDRRFGGPRQVLVTVVARLRFVAILAVIGVVIVEWDLLTAYYDKWTRPTSAAAAAESHVEYFCPMHPTVIRDSNKEKCPICHMPLSKRKKGAATAAPLPAGVVSRVQLTPYRVVLAGVRTAPVGYVPLTREIATVGAVEFDERGLHHIAARVKGRIDKLSVNQTGQMVHAGDELATLYSPDLVVTVQNLLDARRARNKELEQIARDRLVLWGIEPDQIEAIAKGGKAVTHVPVRSPIDGHVIKKYQIEGRYVDEGSPLYDVADLNTVWIQAQLYEEDLGFLPADSHELPADARLPVTATTPAYPGQSFAGTLSFVYPHVDPVSRTLTVRFELKNPDLRLKPGMTATVRLDLAPEKLARRGGAAARFRLSDGKVLAVPEGSVIDTGSLKLVYRESAPNEFEGVKVELGPRMTGPSGAPYFPVLSGLDEGQTVAAAGSFLIDAETRLNPAAGSIYIGGSGSGTTTAATVRPSTPADPDAEITAALARLGPADRALAEKQRVCPITHKRLGSMGAPPKLTIHGKPVFICCEGCEERAADGEASPKDQAPKK
ncbi:MAG TPA: efflux RND transporter periplasmic adaptor subunit [Fimbriiglobus sp.]|nr:efflux RND transporter periplasmic adaptor subunit [Fimbriiglobus sp.]